MKLSHKRHRQSEGRRLLAVFQKMFGKRPMLTSKEVVKQLIADQDDEWADFRGRGPITERQVSLLLDDYDIHPDVIHPPGRPSARGYKAEWFAQVFSRLLLDNRTTVYASRLASRESIRVEHVYVNEGGQAIIGNVQRGVGGDGEPSRTHDLEQDEQQREQDEQ